MALPILMTTRRFDLIRRKHLTFRTDSLILAHLRWLIHAKPTLGLAVASKFMNLILFHSHELASDNTLSLDDDRHRHLLNVLKVKAGDRVRVGAINGLIGAALVREINLQSCQLEVQLDTPAPAKLPLTVVLALPRPKMIRRILRNVAELGIAELHLINSYKVEKSYWQSPALTNENILSYLVDGLQQAIDTNLPRVSLHPRFRPFVEDELPAIAGDSTRLIAHPGTGSACPEALNQPTTLAIGPEGGFIPYEVEKFFEAGFAAIHLGPRILKVENALTALTSKLYSP